MKGEIGVFVLRTVECMASSPETLRIPRMDSKLSEDAAHKNLARIAAKERTRYDHIRINDNSHGRFLFLTSLMISSTSDS